MFVVTTNHDKTNFGWHGSTHRKITQKIAQKYKYSLPQGIRKRFDIGIIRDNCTRPDGEIEPRGHFADIDNLSESPKDAFSLAREYTKKAIISHRQGDYRGRDMHIGYALHFIQDSLAPVHVVFRQLKPTDAEKRFHIAFEKLSTRLETAIIDHIHLDAPDSADFFETTLPKAMKRTRARYEILRNEGFDSLNKRVKNGEDVDLYGIASDSLVTACKISNAYFAYLIKSLH